MVQQTLPSPLYSIPSAPSDETRIMTSGPSGARHHDVGGRQLPLHGASPAACPGPPRAPQSRSLVEDVPHHDGGFLTVQPPVDAVLAAHHDLQKAWWGEISAVREARCYLEV